MASCIKRVAKDVLGESRGGAPPCKDTSWWNDQTRLLKRFEEKL